MQLSKQHIQNLVNTKQHIVQNLVNAKHNYTEPNLANNKHIQNLVNNKQYIQNLVIDKLHGEAAEVEAADRIMHTFTFSFLPIIYVEGSKPFSGGGEDLVGNSHVSTALFSQYWSCSSPRI